MSLQRAFAAWALMLALAPSTAADYVVRTNTRFPIPQGYSLVNDFIPMLRIARQAEVARKLQALEKRNGTQIVFLSVPSAGEQGVEAYARQVAAQWNIGNNGQGNGVLFLVTHDGWYIATGAGIAGAIPDVIAARVSREVMLPMWLRGELSQGIELTIDALIKASHHEETSGTAYDYSIKHVALTREQRIAMVLAVLALAYGLSVLWLRRRRRLARARA